MLRGASPEEENSAGYGAWEGFADTALLWLISITYSTSWLDQNLSKRFLKQLTVSAESIHGLRDYTIFTVSLLN